MEKQGTGMSAIETPSGKNEKTENFPVAQLVRPDLRRHVTAYYIFARAADDISDNPLLPSQDKIDRLDRFAAALTDPADNGVPSCLPLRESLKETGVTPQHALDLLAAFKQDAVKTRYADWGELLDYCRYSASPVGRYVLALHGIGEEAWPANDALCTALQIINHVQDCADDYRELDRVYIPLDIMAAHGADPTDLSAETSSPGLRAALDAVLDLTGPLVQTGRNLPRLVPDTRLKIDTAIIHEVADSLVKLLYRRDPLCDNVKLGALGKAGAALRGLMKAYF